MGFEKSVEVAGVRGQSVRCEMESRRASLQRGWRLPTPRFCSQKIRRTVSPSPHSVQRARMLLSNGVAIGSTGLFA